jgi:hypothetical protein
VLCVPLVVSTPLQAPEAVQEAALVELHVNVDAPPLATATGDASRVTVGTIFTVTLDVELAPPGPAQLNEYVLGVLKAPVLCVPLAGFAPLQAPEAVQEVALAELHVNMDAPPLATDAAEAVKVTVGAMLTVTLEAMLVPPRPLQVSE